MNKYCQHQKIFKGGKVEYYFFTWSIPEVSLINNLEVDTEQFQMANGYTYRASLFGDKEELCFRIISNSSDLKCFASMIVDSKALLLSNSLQTFTSTYQAMYYYDLITIASENESFQKLKSSPNSSLAIICKIMHQTNVSTVSVETPGIISTDSLCKLRPLATVLSNPFGSLLEEKVLLQVDDETETVSKSVLCTRSPVFSRMFDNDMREVRDNKVIVTDIKMPVLKAFISFLYSGKLQNSSWDFLCDLYYAADKYEVGELCQICVDFLIPQISMSNIHRIMKLAFSHNDEVLKSTVMALIATDIETWSSTNFWKNLVDDEPIIAAEIINFFSF